jgi:excisionase family DNA binding protein
MSTPMFLTLKQAAAVVGVSADTLAKNIHAGNLRAKKTAATGGKTLVRVSDLEDWFDGLADA